CAYWKTVASDSFWSSEGCTVQDVNATYVVCGCNHLSSFAVLMATQDIEKDLGLTVITYIGIIISLICLFFTIFTHCCFHSIRNPSTTLQLNLCISLFVAELIFLVGIDYTNNKIACAIIAGILHYSFLACFAWMCLAAVQLCLMVINLKAVKFFRSHVIRRRYMYPVGYGAPAVIVAISAGVDHQGYGTAKHCWLSMERYFLWSFLGPVCLIILVNLTLFIVIIWILKEKLASLDKDVSTVKESRSLTFKVMAQFLILGCTWMFGLFHVGQGTLIMAYVFTILNSFQGLFIFLVYCVLNRQVRQPFWSSK
uniref:Uncharacterized protein n=1 Tax=Latimeria chalumnae TaxID=7897 RepID=H3AWS2_LATCH